MKKQLQEKISKKKLENKENNIQPKSKSFNIIFQVQGVKLVNNVTNN